MLAPGPCLLHHHSLTLHPPMKRKGWLGDSEPPWDSVSRQGRPTARENCPRPLYVVLLFKSSPGASFHAITCAHFKTVNSAQANYLLTNAVLLQAPFFSPVRRHFPQLPPWGLKQQHLLLSTWETGHLLLPPQLPVQFCPSRLLLPLLEAACGAPGRAAPS